MVLYGIRCPYLKILQVSRLPPPFLAVRLPLLGQRPLSLLLGERPVLGRPLLVREGRVKVTPLSSKDHLCWKYPGILHGGVPVLHHCPPEPVISRVPPGQTLSLSSLFSDRYLSSAVKMWEVSTAQAMLYTPSFQTLLEECGSHLRIPICCNLLRDVEGTEVVSCLLHQPLGIKLPAPSFIDAEPPGEAVSKDEIVDSSQHKVVTHHILEWTEGRWRATGTPALKSVILSLALQNTTSRSLLNWNGVDWLSR